MRVETPQNEAPDTPTPGKRWLSPLIVPALIIAAAVIAGSIIVSRDDGNPGPTSPGGGTPGTTARVAEAGQTVPPETGTSTEASAENSTPVVTVGTSLPAAVATQITRGLNDDTAAVVIEPTGLATSSDGRVFVSDAVAGWVRPLSDDGELGLPVFDQRVAATSGLAALSQPGLLTIDSFGGLVIAATNTNLVARLDPQGNLRRLADLPANARPTALGADPNGNILIAWQGTDNTFGALRVSALGEQQEVAIEAPVSSLLPVSGGGWFAGQGEKLVSIASDGASGLVPPLLPGTGSLSAVLTQPDGRLIISRRNDNGAKSGGVWVWDPKASESTSQLREVAASVLVGSDISALTKTLSGDVLIVDRPSRQVLRMQLQDSAAQSSFPLTVVVRDSATDAPSDGSLLAIDVELRPSAVALNESGDVLIAERDRNRIVRVEGDGRLTVVASDIERPFSLVVSGNEMLVLSGTDRDAGTSGSLVRQPRESTTDNIRRGTKRTAEDQQYSALAVLPNGEPAGVDPQGNVTNLSTNATIARTKVTEPSALAIDSAGNVFVIDARNNSIVRVPAGGKPETIVVGVGSSFREGEDPVVLLGTSQDRIASISGITAIGPDQLVVSDVASNRVRLVQRGDGADWTIAPFLGTQPGVVTASPNSQRLDQPASIVSTPSGEIIVVSQLNRVVRRIDATGTIRTIAGGGLPAGAAFGNITALTMVDGRLGATDASRHRVVVLTETDLKIVHGTGIEGSAETELDSPSGLAFFEGVTYISDALNHRVMAVDQSGLVQRVLGTGVGGRGESSGSGPTVALNEPGAIAVTSKGELVVADVGNNRILRLGRDGQVTLVGRVNSPTGIATKRDKDGQEVVLVSSPREHQIFSFAPTGERFVIAGLGSEGNQGDLGPATSARLNAPTGIAVGPDGSVFVADTGNRTVRRIDPTGRITSVSGTRGEFSNPKVLFISARLGMFVGDSNGKLFRVTPDDLSTAAPGWDVAPAR